MTDRIVEDAIEIHGPDGVRKIAMPGECDITRVGAMVLQLMEAAGYEYMRPQFGGAFAFAPMVEPDEMRDDIPGTFDLPEILPVTDAYNLARRHGLMDIHCTGEGVAGRQRDAAGNTWRVWISAEQKEAG